MSQEKFPSGNELETTTIIKQQQSPSQRELTEFEKRVEARRIQQEQRNNKVKSQSSSVDNIPQTNTPNNREQFELFMSQLFSPFLDQYNMLQTSVTLFKARYQNYINSQRETKHSLLTSFNINRIQSPSVVKFLDLCEKERQRQVNIEKFNHDNIHTSLESNFYHDHDDVYDDLEQLTALYHDGIEINELMNAFTAECLMLLSHLQHDPPPESRTNPLYNFHHIQYYFATKFIFFDGVSDICDYLQMKINHFTIEELRESASALSPSHDDDDNNNNTTITHNNNGNNHRNHHQAQQLRESSNDQLINHISSLIAHQSRLEHRLDQLTAKFQQQQLQSQQSIQLLQLQLQQSQLQIQNRYVKK